MKDFVVCSFLWLWSDVRILRLSPFFWSCMIWIWACSWYNFIFMLILFFFFLFGGGRWVGWRVLVLVAFCDWDMQFFFWLYVVGCFWIGHLFYFDPWMDEHFFFFLFLVVFGWKASMLVIFSAFCGCEVIAADFSDLFFSAWWDWFGIGHLLDFDFLIHVFIFYF